VSSLNRTEQRSVAALEVVERPVWTVRLHWWTVVLVLLAFGAVLAREQVEARVVREALLWVHQVSGALVCLLCIVRLVRRGVGVHMPTATLPRGWTHYAAAGVHAVLYAAMAIVPLLGWAFTTAAGRVPPWLLTLPAAWVAEDEDLADRLGDWHHTVAYVWLALIALHVVAALWHHFVLRDGVLRAMRMR
jgi:cytochrome b561